MNNNEMMKHESYGILGFAKSNNSIGKSLYGSSIKHLSTIRLTLKRSECRRRFNKTEYYGGEQLFEVEMSSSQFAELITTMNFNDGIPVTIREINGKQMEECPYANETKEHYNEFKKEHREINKKALGLLDSLSERFKGSKPLTKKEKEEILSELLILHNELSSNEDFRDEQFKKHMEKLTTNAKLEIESFFNNKLHEIATNQIAMKNEMNNPVILIEENGE